jgi:hypothetical protein
MDCCAWASFTTSKSARPITAGRGMERRSLAPGSESEVMLALRRRARPSGTRTHLSLEKGHAGESFGAAAGVGARGSSGAGWRAASLVRTSRRLKRAGMSSGVTVTTPLLPDSSRGPFLRRAPADSGVPFECQQPFLWRSRGLSANNRCTQQPGEPGVLDRKNRGAVAERS